MTDKATSKTPETIEGLTLRTYEPGDQPIVACLYGQGLLAGQIAPNDTGADIDMISEAYLSDPRHHFWVAELHHEVVGMIGVISDEEHTAEVRRLRVDPKFQNTEIPALLLKTAIDFCRHHDYLKVRLDTRFEKDTALSLFDKVGFQHTRTRNVRGNELLEFYLDIYRQPEDKD